MTIMSFMFCQNFFFIFTNWVAYEALPNLMLKVTGGWGMLKTLRLFVIGIGI